MKKNKFNDLLSSSHTFIQFVTILSFTATMFSYSYGQYYLNLQQIDASLYFSIADYLAMYSEKLVILVVIIGSYIGVRYDLLKRDGARFDLQEEFSDALFYISVLSLFLHSYIINHGVSVSFYSIRKEVIILGVLQCASIIIYHSRNKLKTSFIYLACLCCILNISVSYALIEFYLFYPKAPTYIVSTNSFIYKAKVIASSSQYLILDNSGIDNKLVLPLQRVKSIRLVRESLKNTINKKTGETIYN